VLRIATNVCLDALRHRWRVLQIGHGPTADSDDDGCPLAHLHLDDPDSPDARYETQEAVELAFVAAIRHLPARQRAMVLLRDVLGFSAREVAEMTGTTVPSVNSALQRARRTLQRRLPIRSQHTMRRSLDDADVRHTVARMAHAFERGDVYAVLVMLAVDSAD
jgi:RNA polymerase sigma-70 factor (ECF subfamily)